MLESKPIISQKTIMASQHPDRDPIPVPVPEGLVAVEGFTTLRQYYENAAYFAGDVSQWVGDQPTDIILPLNGGLVPAYHAAAGLTRNGQLGLVRFIPIAKYQNTDRWNISNVAGAGGRNIIMIDDMADTLDTHRQVSGALGIEVPLVAMTRKEGTPEYHGNSDSVLVVPNNPDGSEPWIMSSMGLNSNQYTMAEIRANERWSYTMLRPDGTNRAINVQAYDTFLAQHQFLVMPPYMNSWLGAQMYIDTERNHDPQTRIEYIRDLFAMEGVPTVR